MTSCDFGRSFITFVAKERYNNARIQIEARCELTDREDASTESFYLVASCKGEDTYGEGVLFFDPNYDFFIIYSSHDFRMIRTHANVERDRPTVGENADFFLDVLYHVVMRDAEELASGRDVVEATFANRILNGRTKIESPDGRYVASIEFPIKTMNVNETRNVYQVDTGPILLPNFGHDGARMVERFDLAFVAYKQDGDAHFVIRELTPVESENPDGPKVSHYSRITRMPACNSVIALSEGT